MPEVPAAPVSPAAPVATQPQLPLPAPAPEAKRRFELPPEEPKPAAPAAAPAEAPKADADTTDKAPVAEPEAKPEPELTPEQEAKRAARRAQNKLEKAFRQRAEAQARADFLEKQLAEARQQPLVAKKPGEPTLEQFDYDPEKYAQAKADFARKAAEQDLSARQLQDRQRAAHKALMSEWEKKVESAYDEFEDFDTVVGELQPNTPFVAAIMKVPNGHKVAYNLGKNPSEAERIAKLEPLEQIVEITLLAAKLSAEQPKAKTPSKAPAPIAPLTGSTPVASNVPTEQDSMNEWMKKRNKQVASRR